MRSIVPPWPRAATLVVAAVAIALLAPIATAQAARPPVPVPAPVTELAGPHFVVHYTTSGGTAADRLTPEGAALTLANAETAYAWYLSQGYPAALDDGDGKVDIYVFAVPIGPAAGRDDESTDQSSGYILLTPSANNIYAVAHELFHVIQFAMFSHSGFFSESTAEWAGQAVTAATGGSPRPNWFPDPWVPLDCLGSGCGDAPGGYRGSIFWEYLSEHYGTGFVHEAFIREAQLGAVDHQSHDIRALDEALAARGTSLAGAFDGYAQAAVAGQITRPGVLPHTPTPSRLFYAEQPFNYAPQTITVDHLAMRVVAFLGAADAAAPCKPATLDVHVALPPGVPSQPVFVTYPPSGYPPATAVYPLAISGGTASAEIPWATCASSVGSLAVPNASTSADGQPFTISWGVAEPLPVHRQPVRPRLSAKPTQRIGRLSIRVHAYEAATLHGSALVTLPHTRRAIASRSARAKAAAGQTVTLHFRFPGPRLRKIKAVLARRRLKAKIVITSRNAEGASVTQTRSVTLKP